MKYKIIIAAVVVSIVGIIYSGNNSAHANLNGPPTGYTGSPGDGKTCAISGCHSGSPLGNGSGWITSNIPVGGYTPGQTYTITATATFAGKKRFGFQVSPQDLSGNKIGTLVNVNAATQVLVSGKYVEQTANGHGGNGSRTWTFNWTAPASGTGPLKFYGAFNCTDSSGTSSGDKIFTDALPIVEMPTTGLDCGIFSIVNPITAACDSVITPQVKLQNFGTTALTTCTINYFVDANTPSSFTWNGNLSTAQSQVVTLPSLTVTVAGTHTFTATTASPNASTDVATGNDTHTSTFNLIFNGSTLPFNEGFESAAFPPAGWVRNNPNGLTTWAKNTAAHKTGLASAKMDNFNNSDVGDIDELVTPAINLSTDPNPTLTFQVAYRLYTNPASSTPGSDTLRVFISTDCQQTWTQIYIKYGAALTTIVPTFSTAAFTPAAANWRQESISLLPYQSTTTAYLKFQNRTGFENNLYLDDINITGPAGISDPNSELSSLELYPNPAVDVLNVNYQLKEKSSVQIQIYNIEGKIISQNSEGVRPEGKLTESFDVAELPSGIYFMHIVAGETVITRKFIVTHN